MEGVAPREIVTFLGHRDDAVSLMAGSDIAVMPSVSSHQGIETEGFPSWLWRRWR